MKTKILILGGSGKIGHTLFTELSKNQKFDVYTTVRNRPAFSRYFPELSKNIIQCGDAINIDSYEKVLSKIRPDIVINCIGIVKQDKKIKNLSNVLSINTFFPMKLAYLANSLKFRLILISSDCVFSGKKGNYSEADIPDVDDIYGLSKALGEIRLKNVLVIRTSTLGHELKTKNGLVEWFLETKKTAMGFSNAIYSGFPTIELARIVGDFVVPKIKNHEGLYNVASSPITKYNILSRISKIYKKDIALVKDRTFKSNRSLNAKLFNETFGYRPLEWNEMLTKMYTHYINSKWYDKTNI